MDPPQKKKSRKDAGDSSGDDCRLRCDCCSIQIAEDKDHAKNSPCGHNICIPCVLKANMNRVANPACCQVRDCHQKYAIISCQYFNRGIAGEIIENGKIVELGSDDVASILSFLLLKEIMCLRRVNMTWRDAAKKTIVPTSARWDVINVVNYNALRVMATELPNLQRIIIGDLAVEPNTDFYDSSPIQRHKYRNGEDPDEWRANRTYDCISHDIAIISSFSKLRNLEIDANASLNGRYPFLFNSFPLLQRLSIQNCSYLKWDLEMLAGFPLLKELDCCDNELYMTGNTSSLRVLKDTLEKVKIYNCQYVEGNFMDLADFPHLKELDLHDTDVTGDIRDIGENDFSLLECRLGLPKGVYGADGYELQRISNAPDLIRTLYLLQKQRPTLFDDGRIPWFGRLSQDSPDWYDTERDDVPFDIVLFQAGSRVGYRWESEGGKHACEMNWLDPEPDRESSNYEEYIEVSQKIDSPVTFYKGFHQPPTEEEYNGLLEEE